MGSNTTPPGSRWTVPVNLSPSRIESFVSCPLSFRFASIEKLPDPPTEATTKGSLVHRALELFFAYPPDERTPACLDRCVDTAIIEFHDRPEFIDLHLDTDAALRLEHDARRLAANYLQLERPTEVNAIGLELWMEAPVGEVTLRGIIDRLDLTDDGELVVTDYKTGRAPSPQWERKSLSGVHFYAFMCESVLGQRPAAVRLMCLRSGETITATPTPQSIRFMTTRTKAVWSAIRTACERDDFRPKKSALCRFCAYQRWCPTTGGNPDQAAVDVAEGILPARP